MIRLLVTANVLPSSPNLGTLIMKAKRSSETSILTRATWHIIPEDGILHSYSRENFKSYIGLIVWALERRCDVLPVRYELSFYNQEIDIPHSHRREVLKSYIVLTAWSI
jgi:hypothetical protein